MAVRWVQGYAPAVGSSDNPGILQALAKAITNSATDTKWNLHYPTNFTDIDDLFALVHTVGTKTVYIEFRRPDKIEDQDNSANNYFFIEIRFGTNYTSPTATTDQPTPAGVWGADSGSVRSRFAWFKSNTSAYVRGWLPVQYWLSIQDDTIAIILAGDASAGSNDRLVSFGYIGALKLFKDDVGTNPDTNFGVNVSSDISPLDYLSDDELKCYGDNTGNGVIDITMIQTFTGFPMQAHYPAFTATDEFINKQLDGPSVYTNKYHMSPVYVFHMYGGYRGELKGVVATDRSSLVNLDEMIYEYNSTNASSTTPDTKDTYKVFLVNAPYSILNNSNDVLYGIAILKDSTAI